MSPKIAGAKVKFSFQFGDVYRASFCTDIEAPGLVQYHHVLVIYESGKQPILCFGAEWGQLDPDSESSPVLGYFDANGHSNCGCSNQWCDEKLFILQALALARDILKIEDRSLVDGEEWALSEMQKELDLMDAAGEVCLYEKEYRMALSKDRKRPTCR